MFLFLIRKKVISSTLQINGVSRFTVNKTIDHLQVAITWYGINYAGTLITQWDFQNEGTLASPAKLLFLLEVPLRYLHPSVIYPVPCDRNLQRAYYDSALTQDIKFSRLV